MAVGVKPLHSFLITTSSNCPQVCNVAATKVYRFLVVLFVLGKRFLRCPQLPEQSVE